MVNSSQWRVKTVEQWRNNVRRRSHPSETAVRSLVSVVTETAPQRWTPLQRATRLRRGAA
jgi:hypothetical protein